MQSEVWGLWVRAHCCINLIVFSDVCFHRVAGTPSPTSEQIYSDRLREKDLLLSQHDSAGWWDCSAVNAFISKLALSPQNFDLVVSFLFSLLCFFTLLVHRGQTPGS